MESKSDSYGEKEGFRGIIFSGSVSVFELAMGFAVVVVLSSR
jgi:hypothetical protein